MRKNAVCSVVGFLAMLLSGCIDEEVNAIPNCRVADPPSFACTERCTSPDAMPTDIVSACHDLFLQRAAFAQRCFGPDALFYANDEEAYVSTCASVATAPGVTLTAQEIRGCGDQIDASACNRPSPCEGYGADLLYPAHDKKGTLPPGSECFANIQCDSGYCGDGQHPTKCSICVRARDVGESCGEATDLCINSCCGGETCVLVGQRLGEKCTTYGGDNCQRTLYCKDVGSGTINGECAPRIPAGAPCSPSNNHCAEGLWCQAGVCAPPAQLAADGASCAGDAECSSHWCNAGVCATTPSGLAPGDDCSVGPCRGDLDCDMESQVCTARTYLPEGAACQDSGFSGGCETGLFCDIDHVCRPKPQPGEPCPRYVCASGASCEGFDGSDPTKGRCVKRGSTGEACPCVEPLRCLSGACIAYGAPVCE